MQTVHDVDIHIQICLGVPRTVILILADLLNVILQESLIMFKEQVNLDLAGDDFKGANVFEKVLLLFCPAL